MFAMEGADVSCAHLFESSGNDSVYTTGTRQRLTGQVAIVYLPEEQVDAEKTKSLIVANGRQCLLFPQDIRDEQGCNRVIQEVVQAWGRIDILVNNASVMVSLVLIQSMGPGCS